MRKHEMTRQQLSNRETIMRILSIFGWDDPSVGNWFEEGLWAEFEAVMEFDNLQVLLETHYHAADDSIYFYIRNFRGGRILLIIHFDGKLTELLKVITSFQYKISPENYQKYIRQILRICPKTYVVYGEEGDQLAQLVDEEKEVKYERSSRPRITYHVSSRPRITHRLGLSEVLILNIAVKSAVKGV